MGLYRLCLGDKIFTLCIGQKGVVYAAVTNKPKVALEEHLLLAHHKLTGRIHSSQALQSPG